jgi:HEPN domain-containing protein
MPHDPELVAETQAWFVRASQDLGAAEKAFKGFLTWHSTPFRKTHNLEELGEQCLRLDPTLELVVDKAVPLTKYAWKFRYPGESEEPSREEAQEALAIAREVYEAIVTRLPAEVRP